MEQSSCRRQTGRLNQVGLDSNLGPILDLSAGGCRLLASRPLDGEHDIELRGLTETVRARAIVVWRCRLGFRRHDVGLAFVEPDADLIRSLGRLAAAHRRDQSLAA